MRQAPERGTMQSINYRAEFAAVAELLTGHGFVRRPVGRNPYRRYVCRKYLYRKGDLYVEATVSFHPRDFPFCCRVVLGEGSMGWPDCDWNSVALWRLVQATAPDHYPSGVQPYAVPSPEDIAPVMLAVRDDLRQFGQDFLAVFRSVRAVQNQERQPYNVYSPGTDGRYQVAAEPESQRLKERYSSTE